MILIVDDNQENIYSLKKLLELHKFVVDSALSGEEALKKVLKNSYSLIILDVQMPDMDGFEVAEAISGYSKSKDIPILFLSAVNTEKKFITKGFQSGGVDYVTKPFDPDLLLLKVKSFYKISEQNRQLSAMDKFLREEIEFRKKAENELQERVEELKSILESMPQMAFTTKPDGNIEFVNNHWAMYSDDNTAFPTTEGITVTDCMKMAIQTQKQFIQEVRIKVLNGDDYRFHVLYLTPVKKEDHLIKWVGIFTDIHEQKMASQILENKVEERTQELKHINRKLQESNSELQQFAFVASHDLQEPLRKIQVFSNMVMEKYPPPQSEGKRFLEKIISSADRMRKLITDLLDYSRPPDKDLFQETDLNAVVNEVLVDLELKVKAKNAIVDVGPIPRAVVIPGQIKQVFQNLISNALKFSKEETFPEISIRAERVDSKSLAASPTRDGDYLRITLRDNGIGFQQHYADKVFEIFQRLNQKDSYEGTGIGLAIVKKTIDRHNGLISVTSEENVGTKFTIVLPLRPIEISGA
ncbi:response regulator [Chryseolinea lacunae]|uniref:histidine kinase n=1 Tax=Chryseolinea lacunae TaxID=2801331 RepID=A0ABS1L154_9BACT|nr:response regulator [Chryseolinea lacunae]MBL0745310.1 response regulator [Chryseolinea lacunae]